MSNIFYFYFIFFIVEYIHLVLNQYYILLYLIYVIINIAKRLIFYVYFERN